MELINEIGVNQMAEKQKTPDNYMKKLLIWGLIGLFIVMLFSYVFSSNPAAPKNKYGEFPFKLTYELNGETKVIEDVLVCEFDGYKSSGSEKKRVWKTTLKSNSELMPYSDGELVLIDTRERDIRDSKENKVLEIQYFTGSAGYYMGDRPVYAISISDVQELDHLRYLYQLDDGSIGYNAFSPDEAYEKVGIRLISWEGSDPIVNAFYGE